MIQATDIVTTFDVARTDDVFNLSQLTTTIQD